MVAPHTVSAVLRGDLDDLDLYLSLQPLLTSDDRALVLYRKNGATWAEIADIIPAPHRRWDQMILRVTAVLNKEHA